MQLEIFSNVRLALQVVIIQTLLRVELTVVVNDRCPLNAGDRLSRFDCTNKINEKYVFMASGRRNLTLKYNIILFSQSTNMTQRLISEQK